MMRLMRFFILLVFSIADFLFPLWCRKPNPRNFSSSLIDHVFLETHTSHLEPSLHLGVSNSILEIFPSD